MSKHDGHSDRREMRTSASIDQLYAAWSDPLEIQRWFADEARGNAEAGGSIVHVFHGFGFEAKYEVLEAVPGERLVLSGVGPSGAPFKQEIIVKRDGGESVLELIHSGFDEGGSDAIGDDFSDEYKGLDSGWKLALALLKHYLENYAGRDKTSYLAMLPTAFRFDQLHDLFRGDVGRWLTFPGGTPIGGEVLVDTGQEVAIVWDAIDGVLELKAFQQILALRVSSWSKEPPEEQAMVAWMNTALAKLSTELT